MAILGGLGRPLETRGFWGPQGHPRFGKIPTVHRTVLQKCAGCGGAQAQEGWRVDENGALAHSSDRLHPPERKAKRLRRTRDLGARRRRRMSCSDPTERISASKGENLQSSSGLPSMDTEHQGSSSAAPLPRARSRSQRDAR